MVAVGLLPIRRGACLGEQQDGGRRVEWFPQVPHHELHIRLVPIVVDPAEQVVLARNRGLDDAPRRVLLRRYGDRRQRNRGGAEVHVLPGDAGRCDDRERFRLIADLTDDEVQCARRRGHPIAAGIVRERGESRFHHADDDEAERRARQRVVDRS